MVMSEKAGTAFQYRHFQAFHIELDYAAPKPRSGWWHDESVERRNLDGFRPDCCHGVAILGYRRIERRITHPSSLHDSDGLALSRTEGHWADVHDCSQSVPFDICPQ